MHCGVTWVFGHAREQIQFSYPETCGSGSGERFRKTEAQGTRLGTVLWQSKITSKIHRPLEAGTVTL